MKDTAAKLAHLLPHWVEHNEAHEETFRQWGERARGEGFGAVADALDEAIRCIQGANRALGAAAAALPPHLS